jgi:hypothetical protein
VVDNALTAVDNLSSAARQAAAADSLNEAQRAAASLAVALEHLLHGVDQDGSGAIDAAQGEDTLLAVNRLAAELAVIPLYHPE